MIGADLLDDFDRQRVDRAVVEAASDRGLDQAVLVDPGQALELGRLDFGPQVVTAAVSSITATVDARAGPPRSFL